MSLRAKSRKAANSIQLVLLGQLHGIISCWQVLNSMGCCHAASFLDFPAMPTKSCSYISANVTQCRKLLLCHRETQLVSIRQLETPSGLFGGRSEVLLVLLLFMGCEFGSPTHLLLMDLNPGPQAWHWKEPTVLTQTLSGQELESLHSSISAWGGKWKIKTLKNWISCCNNKLTQTLGTSIEERDSLDRNSGKHTHTYTHTLVHTIPLSWSEWKFLPGFAQRKTQYVFCYWAAHKIRAASKEIN